MTVIKLTPIKSFVGARIDDIDLSQLVSPSLADSIFDSALVREHLAQAVV